MQNTEPPITHGPAGQEQPSNQTPTGAVCAGPAWGICMMLITQVILGAGVNLYVHVPAADQGQGPGTALGRALTSPPANLAAHAALGMFPLVPAVIVLTRAIQVGTSWRSRPVRASCMSA